MSADFSTEKINPSSNVIPQPKTLELTTTEFQQLGQQAIEIATNYLEGITAQPVFKPMQGEERLALLEQALPEQGLSPQTILDRFEEQILPHPMGNGHPRFFGWVNSPPAPIAILAELLAATMNPSCAGGDHAAIYLERCVTRWLMELVGFPVEGSMGLLVSGGSMASLTCLAAAREWATRQDGWEVREEGLQSARPKLVMYVSGEGHSCLRKAAELMGLGASALRTIPVDANFRMEVEVLRQAIEADLAAGNRPFCVAASAGTVNTGAIDPLAAIAEICQKHKLWLHVDGAYGAVGILDERIAAEYKGLEQADSLALDPHKWLSVPVECGAALVRHGKILRETFSLVPDYLRTEEGKGFGGLPWFSEYGFQQSRGFRALKLWMTLQYAGRAGLTAMISRHNSLAYFLAAQIETAPDLERLAPVQLSIVCFRYVPQGWGDDQERSNALNKKLMEELQAGGEVFVSGTMLKGKFALRACILHYATTEQDIEFLVKTVRQLGERLFKAEKW